MNLKDYKLALKINEEISEKINEIKKNSEKEKHRIQYDVYAPMIRAIEEKRNKVIEALKHSTKEKEDQLHSQRPSTDQYIKFLNFIEAFHIGSDTSEITCYTRERYYQEKTFYTPIDTLVQTKYLTIQAFITKNKKPKNQFSLILVGNSPFNRIKNLLKKELYDYGIDATSSGSIKVHLKDAITKEELNNWYTKKKSTLLKEWIEQHIALEPQYEEAVKVYKKDKGWQKFYWQDQMNNCAAGSDSYNFASDMHTIVSTPNKNLLPLLIGHLKTEDGNKELEKLLKGNHDD